MPSVLVSFHKGLSSSYRTVYHLESTFDIHLVNFEVHICGKGKEYPDGFHPCYWCKGNRLLSTGKVFTKIGYNWRPTGKTFTLVGNMCPLTRITATNKVPLREPIPLEVIAQKSIVTKIYTKRPKVPKTNGTNSKPKIAKSVISNKRNPVHLGDPILQLLYLLLLPSILGCPNWFIVFGLWILKAHDRISLSAHQFVHKFLGTVKFGNDQIAKIMGYGDYQIGNIIDSRVYYMAGLGHNLFFVGQFCNSDLEAKLKLKRSAIVTEVTTTDALYQETQTQMQETKVVSIALDALNECR
ncbi:hypothetical protein Tco_0093676 [Tanacetum coccineum]